MPVSRGDTASNRRALETAIGRDFLRIFKFQVDARQDDPLEGGLLIFRRTFPWLPDDPDLPCELAKSKITVGALPVARSIEQHPGPRASFSLLITILCDSLSCFVTVRV